MRFVPGFRVQYKIGSLLARAATLVGGTDMMSSKGESAFMVAANVGRVSDIPGLRPWGRKMNIFTDGLQGRGLMQSLRRCLPAIRVRAFDK